MLFETRLILRILRIVTFFFQIYKTDKESVIIEIVWKIENVRYRLGFDNHPQTNIHTDSTDYLQTHNKLHKHVSL